MGRRHAKATKLLQQMAGWRLGPVFGHAGDRPSVYQRLDVRNFRPAEAMVLQSSPFQHEGYGGRGCGGAWRFRGGGSC